MPIKIRLLISYMAMLLIPVILTIVAAILIGVFYFGIFFNYYGLNIDGRNIKSSIEKDNKVIEEVLSETHKHPEKLKDIDFVKKIDANLNKFNSGIIVEKYNKTIYISKILKDKKLSSKISSVDWNKYGTEDIRIGSPSFHQFLGTGKNQLRTIEIDKKIYAISKYDFVYDDNSKGVAYIFTNMSPMKQFVVKYFSTLVGAIILILIFTDILLTFFVSRSIVRPLQYLKKAANEIKNGNLNYEVKYKVKDEIGELASAFEEMRLKLKESIEMEQQYEENRRELVSNISHDLKTPITTVKGYVEGIIDGVADTPDKMSKYIKTIYTKTNEIDKLIDELFLYSRLDLKKLTFDFEKIDMRSYLNDCSEELAFDLEVKGIDIKFECYSEGSIVVIGDREKLNRAIMNIIGNSVKYMDKNRGKITIELIDKEKVANIRIIDNGQGINQEDVPFIFDRFYRTDPSRNTGKGGSGLGLAIVKNIIEEHGGSIWAESEPGIGTTISFTLKKA